MTAGNTKQINSAVMGRYQNSRVMHTPRDVKLTLVNSVYTLWYTKHGRLKAR
jgi:hypothetical protein